MPKVEALNASSQAVALTDSQASTQQQVSRCFRQCFK